MKLDIAAEFAAVGRRTRQRWVLAAILLLTLLIAYIDRVNVSILIADPRFLGEMGIAGKPVAMGLIMSAFLLAYGVSNVLLSPLGDYLGPRKAMCLSILLWSVSLCVGGLAGSFGVLIAARVLLGVGEALHWPMQSKYVKNWFPPVERGKANSLWLLGLFGGPAVAMPLFTWMIKSLGWRPSFFLLALAGFVPLVLLWFCTADHPTEMVRVNQAERDYIASGLSREGSQAAGTVWDNVKLFIADYRFWLVTLFSVCHASVWWGAMAWLPSYLKKMGGFSWSQMGALASLPYLLATVCVLLFGWLTDKAGRRAPFAAASTLLAGTFVYLGAHTSHHIAAASLISLGIASLAIGQPANFSLLQQIVPSKAIGTGAGLQNGITNGFAALAPIGIGWLISVTGSYAGGLMYLVFCAIVGTLAMAVLAVKRY